MAIYGNYQVFGTSGVIDVFGPAASSAGNPLANIASSSAFGGVSINTPFSTFSTSGFIQVPLTHAGAIQVNVQRASSAANLNPGGTLTFYGSADGINPVSIGGSSAVVFATSGTFSIPLPMGFGFNYILPVYSANSSSAVAAIQAWLSSKTYSV